MAMRWLSAAALVVLVAGVHPVLAQAPVRKTVAVQVFPATEADTEVANQVRKIAVDTLENHRNMLTRRYLTDKDVKLAEEMEQLVDEANRKVSTGMRSTVFDEGVEELDTGYLKSKGALGELEVELVAKLYLGLCMAKAVLGNRALATDYMSLYVNLLPDKGRQSVGYNKLFLEIWDEAKARIDGAAKVKVTVVAEPPDALIGIDGKVWGRSPLEVELTAGSHLVQAEAEGYERGGWIKDPKLHGRGWKITLQPFANRTRYLDSEARLRRHFSPVPAEDGAKKKKGRGRKKKEEPVQPLTADEAERLLLSLSELLSVDYLLYVTVATEGGSIRMRGAFATALGVLPVDAAVARDVRIIDSVREVLLKASDVAAQRKELASLEAAQQRERLARWADDLLADVDSATLTLGQRGKQWALVGQEKKAELFAQTAADTGAMARRLRSARELAVSDPERAREGISDVADEWKELEGKVRSLLAWDIERAIYGQRTREMRELEEDATQKLKDARALLDAKREKLAPKDHANFEKELQGLRKLLEEAHKLMLKDPVSTDARGRLYRILIKEAEIRRLLSLI
jgi:hypothetical protein